MNNPSSRKIKIRCHLATLLSIVTVFLLVGDFHAQDKPNSGPDVILFSNGEKLIGRFEGFSGGAAKFKSDTVGEVIVPLNKIQELHTSQKFAVITKNLKLGKAAAASQIPQGTISVANQKVEVDAGNGQSPQSIEIASLGDIIDEAGFEQALHRPGIFADWKGAVTVGSSIVEATQNSLSFNTSVNLVRATPSVSWLPPRDRTAIDFSDSYGTVTQPDTPTIKTSIYHADAERDEYFTSRFYALGSIAFDHNFSQGLDLQQVYGGGIGWAGIQRPNQTLTLNGTIDYEKQSFLGPTHDINLADSIFTETYSLKFHDNIAIQEKLSASPAWTDARAYSTYASVGIILPVHKRFGFNANVIDSFLNDPPPDFKKNSVQFTTGLSYTLP
ncbi:MAG: DUF481 domain-containing protein [Candidatus Acidiferrales bacterium]